MATATHLSQTTLVVERAETAPPAVPLGDDPLLRSRLPSLDGLRFLAAASIIIYHGGGSTPVIDGVNFFFVLSGFLFAILLDREFRRTGTIDLKSFYTRRAVRILPAFYAAIVITIVGKLLLGAPVNGWHAAAASLFSGNYYNALHEHPADGFAHFWSLAVEEQFYLVWPALFLVLSRAGRRGLIWFLVISIVAVGSWRTIVEFTGIAGDAYAYNAFECRFDSLAVGCLLGLLNSSARFRRLIHRSCPTGLEPLLVIVCLAWEGTQPTLFEHGPGFTLAAILMGILLLQLVVLGAHPLWRWLNWRSLRFLGTLSYSAYLLHAWGLSLATRVPRLPLSGRLAVGIAATMLLAFTQYCLIERPALAWRERSLDGTRRRTATSRTESPVKLHSESLTPAVAVRGV